MRTYLLQFLIPVLFVSCAMSDEHDTIPFSPVLVDEARGHITVHHSDGWYQHVGDTVTVSIDIAWTNSSHHLLDFPVRIEPPVPIAGNLEKVTGLVNMRRSIMTRFLTLESRQLVSPPVANIGADTASGAMVIVGRVDEECVLVYNDQLQRVVAVITYQAEE